MTLEIDLVAALASALAPEEMIKTDLIERGSRGVCGNMTANIAVGTIRPHHHRHGVPPHHTFDTPLDFAAAWKRWLPVGRNGIDVRGWL
jgi:hypothetical protein